MLENIFKAFSGVMAKSLSSVLQHSQDPEQYGFTQNRSCMEPTRIRDSINYCPCHWYACNDPSPYLNSLDAIVFAEKEKCHSQQWLPI